MSRSSINRAPSGFREAIDSALALLHDYAEPSGSSPQHQTQPLPSLLEQCEHLLAEAEIHQPPPIRTLHALAGTGATLISRCLAAQPNTQLLSEVDPLSPFVPGGFLPTDLIGLSRFSSRPADQNTQIELFLAGLHVLYKQTNHHRQALILREHSHGVIHFGDSIPERPGLNEIVRRAFPLTSLVIVRHPLDAFLSLQESGWVQHFSPPTLEEYARRVHTFLDIHADAPLIRYEDFVADPQTTMQRLCTAFMLSYHPEFADAFTVIELSGNSGRSGDTISARPRRAHSPTLEQEAQNSEVFQRLLARLEYPC